MLLLNGWEIDGAPPLPAIHVEAREGGTRLWVHAPTVAERLGLGSSLGHLVARAVRSPCPGDTWRALLTPALTKACSFKVGESTDALSVRLDIAADGELSDWEFSLSTIRPVAAIQRSHSPPSADRKPKARRSPLF